MAHLTLSSGEVVLVDEEDLAMVHCWSWHRGSGGYARRHVDGKTVLLHRLVLDAKPGQRVDHINRDKLDNRRANLRLCTASTNGANRRKESSNTSGYKGVTWSKKARRWQAQLGFQGKVRFLGYFQSPADAARAYDQAAIAWFGEYAYTNKKESRE